MTVLDQVVELLVRMSPAAICDDCIADRLGLTARQRANHKTIELGGSPGFERLKGACSICGDLKKVIRHH